MTLKNIERRPLVAVDAINNRSRKIFNHKTLSEIFGMRLSVEIIFPDSDNYF